MDPVLIVSPHLDDAVLSCGQFMADWVGCTVWTVCAGDPPAVEVTSFDRNSGFATPSAGMAIRRDEDRAAVAMLRGTTLHGDIVDSQYRDGPFPIGDAIDAFAAVYDDVQPVRVLAPLGLVHPDHVGVASTIRTWYSDVRPDCELWAYEELPNRVEEPTAVADALLHSDLLGWTCEKVPKGRDWLADKLIAAWMYGSQAWALRPYQIACDERFWRLTP